MSGLGGASSSSKPLLSICIPTFNRARFLAELLDSIEPQLPRDGTVEIVICDNASPDDTPALVEARMRSRLPLRYYRNETNLGPDANILRCFREACGQYLWIIGDDDVLAPGTFATLMPHLRSGALDLVYVNSYTFESDATAKAASRSNPRAYSDAAAFLLQIHVFVTYLSGMIVNRDRVLEQSHDFESLLGTNLVQLGWVYTALNHFRQGLYVSDRLVGMRVNNTGGYGLFTTFGPMLKTVTERWLANKTLQRIVLNGALQRFWPPMALHVRSSPASFARESSVDVLSPAFRNNYRYWLYVYPVLVAPQSLARVWTWGMRALNAADRLTGLRMLR